MPLNLPLDFKKEMEIQLNDEFSSFEAALNQIPPTSIRINRFKNKNIDTDLEKIDWCEDGFYLADRPVFTLDPVFHGGGYYVQEASSMWIAQVIKDNLDLSKPLRVLDMCAAPGGKSTLVASLISTDSLLISNEVIKSRSQILKDNLAKWGNPNIIISNHDPADFVGFQNYFDLILVDAPCSGEGMFRKDPNAMNEWSMENILICGKRQHRILGNTVSLLKQRGYLIYSTCTYNATENEQSVQFLMDSNLFVEIAVDDDRLVKRKFGYQCFPHKIKGEGFYFSMLKKKGNEINSFTLLSNKSNKWLELTKGERQIVSEWVENDSNLSIKKNYDGLIFAWQKCFNEDYALVETSLKKWTTVLEIGTIKGKDLIPSHTLALSNVLSPKIKNIDLDLKSALYFLKKENFEIENLEKGWMTVSYQNIKLGWIKNIGNRFNNYLPNFFRIQMPIDFESIMKK